MMRSGLWIAVAALLLLGGARLPAQSPAGEVQPLPPIEVEAQRRSVEKRINGFIAAITPHDYADSLVRWHHGICPIVVGPPPAQIDQILAHVSAVAAASGVTLQPKPCNTNFYIVATTYPEKLLKTWSKRDGLLFGNANRKLIDQFLDTPRAVRVWYNTAAADKPVDDGVNPEPFGGLMTPINSGAGVNAGGTVADAAANTRALEFNEVQHFTSVIVVVDTQRTAGIKLGSVSDYVAMVGLSKINLDANVAGAPSILQLFAATAGNSNEAPSNLTAWDRDYLRGLYATRQSSRLQRAAIADMMVRDIVR